MLRLYSQLSTFRGDDGHDYIEHVGFQGRMLNTMPGVESICIWLDEALTLKNMEDAYWFRQMMLWNQANELDKLENQ